MPQATLLPNRSSLSGLAGRAASTGAQILSAAPGIARWPPCTVLPVCGAQRPPCSCLQVAEEEYLIQELRKIEARKKEREKRTQDLQKLITAADTTTEQRRAERKAPKKKLPQKKETEKPVTNSLSPTPLAATRGHTDFLPRAPARAVPQGWVPGLPGDGEGVSPLSQRWRCLQ